MHSVTQIKVVFLVLVGFLLSTCSLKSSGSWMITTPEGVKVWLSSSDTQLTYCWEGGVFDSVAHGRGVLTVLKDNLVVDQVYTEAFYGAIQKTDIVTVESAERYVGATENDLFEGYGAYVKGNEIYIGSFHEGKPNGFLTLYRNSKVYYSGLWRSGLFHGEGTLYKEDGTIKTGEWDNGHLNQTFVDTQLAAGHYKGYVRNTQPDGSGYMKYANGDEYQGAWKQGRYHGFGLLSQGRDSILGQWVDGKLTGDALFRTDSLVYEGGFVDNIPTGVGVLSTADGSYYSGTWSDGKRSGVGDMLFANGDTYSGDWKDNEFHGVGKFIYAQLFSTYEGQWREGLPDGVGYYRSPSFAYRGEWDKGWMDGDGVLVFKNGDKYEGTVHENKIDGVGVYEYANGNRYEGEFVEGLISGNGVFQFKDGNRFEGEFYKGKIYGDGTLLLKTKEGIVSITGFWPLDGSFPKEGSMLFANGDLYEGPLEGGYPTPNGHWVSGADRLKKIKEIENSTLHKANEFYKRHRETIELCVVVASIVLTVIERATKKIALPVAVAASTLNTVINVLDASAAIASAGIDAMETRARGEDPSEADGRLAKKVALNVALVLAPKVLTKVAKPLGTSLKYVLRSSAALASKSGSLIKKSTLRIGKGMLLNKLTKVSTSIQSGSRKVEKILYRAKTTQNLTIATNRLFTGFKHQAVSYNSYLAKIKNNPSILNELKLGGEGSSKTLAESMQKMMGGGWPAKNELIKRYLNLPRRQVEAHHVIPSNPITETGRRAKEIWCKYYQSVDHPLNGIWVGKGKGAAYKGLAKGSNHGPNTREYEEYIGNLINDTYNKFKDKYANNPEMMQKVLGEAVDQAKKRIYKGQLAIGRDGLVHTTLSIFRKEAVRGNARSLSRTLQLTAE